MSEVEPPRSVDDDLGELPPPIASTAVHLDAPPPAPLSPEPSPPAVAEPSGPIDSMAIASLVFSVIGAGLAGAILGHVALRRVRVTRERGRGLALAGVVLGWIEVGLTAVLATVLVLTLVVPIFQTQQASATDAGVKADLVTAKVAIIGYAIDHPDETVIPPLDESTLGQYGYVPGNEVVDIRATGDLDDFVVIAQSSTGHVFQVDLDGAVEQVQ